MIHRRMASALLAVALVAMGVGATQALVHFDFEQKYFNEPPEPVLDHVVVMEGDVYHLFYLRGNPARDIGHATTTDFIHWELQDPVLGPGSWDGRLWAPYIYKEDPGIYYLFYTGVNTYGSQRTGLAVGTNTYYWTKFPNPVYSPDPSWAEWTDSTLCHGRDPHVVKHNGKYYQFVTAKTWWNKGAVGCAESTNLVDWTDIGPIFVNTSWQVLESVFIMFHNNKWHMFFTEQNVMGTSHMASDSLLEGWDISSRITIDPGHAPQITALPSGVQLFSRHAVYNDNHGTQLYNLRFDPLKWIGDWPFVEKPWPLADDWNIVQGNAFTWQPVFGNNPYVRWESVDTNHKGWCWIGTKEYYTGPLGMGAPGAVLSDTLTGVIRSNPFSITGNSMNLLVGGGDFPGECYVALKDNATGETLFSETGKNTDEMDRRLWDLAGHVGRTVYIEIADLSAAEFGHINVDDIVESQQLISPPPPPAGGGTVGRGKYDSDPGGAPSIASRRTFLHPNVPNPFNPTTTITFELEAPAHVRLDVYDVVGQHVATLVDEAVSAPVRDVQWSGLAGDGTAVGSGIYFYRLVVDGQVVQTRKMILLK